MEIDIKSTRYRLFEYFNKQHNLILTESEIDEILEIIPPICTHSRMQDEDFPGVNLKELVE